MHFKKDQIANNKNFEFITNFFKKDPLVFVDIGARGGAHEIINSFSKLTNVIAFEPDKEEFEKLKISSVDKNDYLSFTLINEALDQTSKKTNLYIASNPNNTSLLEISSSFFSRYGNNNWHTVEEVPIYPTTFDSVMKNENIQPDIIKIDVQGGELRIFEGAHESLDNYVNAVISEVSFIEAYCNQPMFSDIELFLRKKGFSFIGFLELNSRSSNKNYLNKNKYLFKERLFWGDALFIKDVFDSNGNEIQKLRQAFTNALILTSANFNDLAIEQLDYLKKNEFKETINEIKAFSKKSYDTFIENINNIQNLQPERLKEFLFFIDKYRLFNDYKNL